VANRLRRLKLLAAIGQGFWREANVPESTRAAANDIRANFRENIGGANPPTVIGYKYEIAVPKPNQSGIPTVTIKRWGQG